MALKSTLSETVGATTNEPDAQCRPNSLVWSGLGAIIKSDFFFSNLSNASLLFDITTSDLTAGLRHPIRPVSPPQVIDSCEHRGNNRAPDKLCVLSGVTGSAAGPPVRAISGA